MFPRHASKKKNLFRTLPSLEALETRLVPAGEFTLHSLPGATKRIYIDFDGHTTTNTYWLNGGTIVSPAYDIDNNTSSFSSSELANIRDIWERVTEDFLPFNVDVTTEDPGIEALRKVGTNDTEWGIRVVISNNISPAPSAGGVAYLNSFSWDTDTPCFVFPINLGNNNKAIAEASSHEVGHTLDLSHDGDSTQGYYPGHGSGPTGWAPIMGVGYYQNLTQWSKGEYSGANQTQDDLAIITNNTNGFGYRTDDYGSGISTASNLVIQNSTTINTTGIIERNTDLDFFRFDLTVGGTVNINVDPAAKGPNLDIEAKLYSSGGNLLANSNPVSALNATLSANLQAGTYYISVDGVGMGNPQTTGYTDYGSLGFYSITGTVPNASSPPVITGPTGGPGATTSSTTINENSTAVHTFSANKTVSWSLSGGLDQSRFSINSSTGALTFVTAPDFENPADSDKNNTYLVTVRALDSSGLSSTQTITVTIANVVELPPVISGPSGGPGAATSSKTIAENTTTVHIFSADKNVTWTLAGGSDQGRFVIDPITGTLSFLAAPDFEKPADSDKNNTYIVTIRATDASGLISSQTLTVTVGDVTENPPTTGTPRTDIYGAKVIYISANGISNGAITGFRVMFNEPINPNTFTSADITFTSPTGATLGVNAPVVVANTNNTEFTFTLTSGASATGEYNLKIGADIRDLAGNQMNQNGNPTNGESTQDAYLAKFNILATYTITNTKVVTIKDNSKIVSTITINQSINIKDLNVLVNIAHTADSDLIISLKSPTGQVSYLSNRRGAWGDNFTNTIFDDAASSTIASGSAPFSGTFRPDSLLSVFNDKNAKGVWTLTIEDKASGDVGKLVSWKLNILSNTKLASTTNLVNSDGGTVTSSTLTTAFAGLVAPSASPQASLTSNSASAPVNKLPLPSCGCPACCGFPIKNLAGAKTAGKTAIVNHQSQSDLLFAKQSASNLFRL